MKKIFPRTLCAIVAILICTTIASFTSSGCNVDDNCEAVTPHQHLWTRPEIYDEKTHYQICLDCGAKAFYDHSYKNCICICGKQEPNLQYTLLQDISCSVTGKGTIEKQDIIIPEAYLGLPVTSIGDNAFNGCTTLTSVSITNGVIFIGKNAFKNCTSLRSVSLPNSLTNIDEYAFYGCCSLAKISIPQQITVINYNAFYDCSSLTSITLPKGLKTIDKWAFGHCRLLNKISYRGTVYDWNLVEKNIGWDYGLTLYTVYCTDGEITKDGKVTKY